MNPDVRDQVNNAFGSASRAATQSVEFERRQQLAHFAQHKEKRRDASDYELALESLGAVQGWDADEREFYALLLAFSLGGSPLQQINIYEADAGRRLRGDPEVADESFKRRWVRRAKYCDERQRERGRMLFKREKGRRVETGRKDGARRFAAAEAVNKGPRYLLWLPQAVVDIARAAKRSRKGTRRDRFRDAAPEVVATLPACQSRPPKPQALKGGKAEPSGPAAFADAVERHTGERPKGGPPKPPPASPPLKPSRAAKTFRASAAQMLKAAKERGPEALTLKAAQLYVELARAHAEVAGETLPESEDPTAHIIRQTIERLEAVLSSSSTSGTENILTTTTELPDSAEAGELVAPAQGRNSQKPQEKHENAPEKTDGPVQKLIPQKLVDEVRESADIVEIVGVNVTLKRAGPDRYKGRCPFHQEKTASFTVTRSKGLYHCFGCQKGGNVFNFVMEMEGVTFPEAVRIVAEKAGVSMPRREAAKRAAPKPEPRIEYDPAAVIEPEFEEDFFL